MLGALNGKWERLVALTADKGRRLRQAAAQKMYNKTLEDARLKLEELEVNLQSRETGTDLRHCKQLLNKHQVGLDRDKKQAFREQQKFNCPITFFLKIM